LAGAMDETVEWVPYVGSRQLRRAITSVPAALHILKAHRPGLVVSTGAALALPYLLAARSLRIPVTYLESATRLVGPSLTGRVLQRIPGVDLNHQAKEWVGSNTRWKPYGSIFDAYTAISAERCHPPRSVLITLGSERFSFTRAIAMVMACSPKGHLAWQTGHTDAPHDLPGEVRAWWPGDELAAAARAADITITHAGVGSILMVLRAGRCPGVIPRSAEKGEHIDDHQEQLAGVLESRGLVVVAREDDDLGELIDRACGRQVVRTGSVRSDGRPI